MSNIGLFFRQFRILAWKNMLLKWRYIWILVLEIAIPTIILVAIGFLRTAISPKQIAVKLPSTFTPTSTFTELYAFPNCEGQNLIWNCNQASTCVTSSQAVCQLRKIAVAPSVTSNTAAAAAASNFIAWANANYPSAANYSTFEYFSSEQAFLNKIEDVNYAVLAGSDIYSTGIIFNSAYPNWDYTLRMNKTYSNEFGSSVTNVETSAPNLDIYVKYGDDSPKSGGDPYLDAYMNTGFVALADVVNTFVASSTCVTVGKCTAGQQVNITTLGGAQFPSPSATINSFWGAVGFIFSLLMIMTLLYPLANVIRALVQEKESKIREGMLMMAMRNDALWLSWSLHFVCLFLPLSIILTLVSGNLFVYSEPIYIFFYFFVFFLASTSYCVLVSTFFNKALTAAIVGCLVFFLGFFIYIGMSTATPTRAQMMVACLHPSTAFTFGTLAFMEYEDAQIGVTSHTWNVSNTYPITFQDTLNMMFIDMIWMAVLSWYIASIWPSEFGTHKPWYFVFMPDFWISLVKGFFCCCKTSHSSISHYSKVQLGANAAAQDDDVPVEAVTENLRAQVTDKKCVDITNLYKCFETATGPKVAVDGLSLTMYSGQITALLGHNGAGKSTVISMLTGLIPCDGGGATVEGLEISEDMDTIRRNLGVCPQHDILFPDLTVQEHLQMFASFKGTPRSGLDEEVEKMIQAVGLTEKRHIRSKLLSGGQKRKLSVGIAFIGGSRIVFLDEPTSGMDPYSRRFTWNVIRQHREGRVIVLTTHFMDEADLLGDRIAIMGDGKLRCCGSSLFLKRKFGVGYNMTIEKKDVTNFDSHLMRQTITKHVKEATVLTDVGTEMTFQLPFTATSAFSDLFEELDAEEDALGLQSYGMSVTTLEEVFIKVAHGTSTIARAEAGRAAENHHHPGKEEPGLEMVVSKSSKGHSNSVPGEEIMDADVADMESNSKGAVTFKTIDEEAHVTLFFRHVHAMLTKRALYFTRDTKSWIFQLVVPILFLLVGMLIKTYASFTAEQGNKLISPHLYNPSISDNYLPTRFNNASSICAPYASSCSAISGQADLMSYIPTAAHLPLLPDNAASSIFNISTDLYNNRKVYTASQIGAATFFELTTFASSTTLSSIAYVIHGNYTALHAAPLYQLLVASGIVASIDPTATVTLNIHPLPSTNAEKAFTTSQSVDLIVTFLLLAIPYIPASFATYVVREREVKAKHQQMVSGVSVAAYWIGTFLWDNMSYQFTAWSFIVLICIFPETQLLAGIHNGSLGCMIGLILLFGGAISGFSYFMSMLFASPAMAQIAMIFIILILGLILGIVGIVLRILIPDPFLGYIRYFLALFPPFALADGLHNLAFNEIWSSLELKGGAKYHPADWKIAGLGLAFLGAESIVFLVGIILYEYIGVFPSFRALFAYTGELPVDNTLRDNDVLAEEERVRSGAADNSAILVKDLKKMYPGGKYAVRGVSLGIPNGECFGLLGINGAGKSSLLSILSGEFQPSSGEAHLAGLNLLTDIHKCRHKIGFCPQFDSLFELLTGREHLQLYARIKGIVAEDIERVVEGKIAEMGLTEYAGRAAGSYSGGNKRKLSVAIAMIGEPSIVFLDEPSTGMDPMARRFMWEVISDIVTKREKCSLILTTHSMEECEALCTRIGIMVGGVMRCLGNSQHLRTLYGHGYQIEIGMVVPTAQQVASEALALLGSISRLTGNENASDEAGAVAIMELTMTKDEVLRALTSIGLTHWGERIVASGSGAELQASLDINNFVTSRQVASWVIFEKCYEAISAFLVQTFGAFVLRERQTAKLRVEVSAAEDDGHGGTKRRRLAEMFNAIETRKEMLCIQEYSIVQTSLEQIFNQFAAQQEEETGVAQGIV